MTDRTATFALAAAVGILLLATAFCGRAARAAAPATEAYVVDLNQPAMQVPAEWAEGAGAVAQCESRWNPRAVSPTGDYGLFQINAYWQRLRIARMGYTVADLLDPRVSALLAIDLWTEQGWKIGRAHV